MSEAWRQTWVTEPRYLLLSPRHTEKTLCSATAPLFHWLTGVSDWVQPIDAMELEHLSWISTLSYKDKWQVLGIFFLRVVYPDLTLMYWCNQLAWQGWRYFTRHRAPPHTHTCMHAQAVTHLPRTAKSSGLIPITYKPCRNSLGSMPDTLPPPKSSLASWVAMATFRSFILHHMAKGRTRTTSFAAGECKSKSYI